VHEIRRRGADGFRPAGGSSAYSKPRPSHDPSASKSDAVAEPVPHADDTSRLDAKKGDRMFTSFRRARTFSMGIALALVATACSVGADDAGDASIGFVTPSDGATVSVPFDVEIEASEPLDEPTTGNRHAHIYFDSLSDNPADYDIVYGTTWEVTRELSPGEHTLIVALANPDHSLVGPQQEITVTVGEDGGEGADGDAGSDATPAPTIDY
jgi:hypothetical protein